MNERLASVLSKIPTALLATAKLQSGYRDARVKTRVKRWQTWADANPDRVAAHHERSRVKRATEFAAACAELSAKDLAAVECLIESWRVADVWSCAYCGRCEPSGKRTVDHVIALSKGGKHEPGNLKPACRPCNSRKGTRSTYYA